MARKDPRPEVSRRKFLAGVAVAGAAATTAANVTNAATPPASAAKIPSALRPTARQIAAETGVPKDMPHLAGRAGSDFMVDVIKSLTDRIHLLQPGIELPRPPRVADQLRQEHEARIHHLHARGILGRDGARLFQGHRQAADGALPRHRRPACTRPWRSTTPGATACRSSSSAATISTPPSVRRACRPSTRRRTSMRSCATSPSGTTRRCRCSTSRNRSCAPTSTR